MQQDTKKDLEIDGNVNCFDVLPHKYNHNIVCYFAQQLILLQWLTLYL